MLLVLIILYLFLLKRWGFLAVHNDMMVNVIVIWMTSVVITAVWVVTIGGVRATASAAALHNACEWHWMYTLLFQSKQGNKTVDSTPQKVFYYFGIVYVSTQLHIILICGPMDQVFTGMVVMGASTDVAITVVTSIVFFTHVPQCSCCTNTCIGVRDRPWRFIFSVYCAITAHMIYVTMVLTACSFPSSMESADWDFVLNSIVVLFLVNGS
eukprot:TRINITY_DN2778_c0_g1_i2.p1 TRINITY_DN2778_c0_g1~~TRINITY_DN2778_c0_g1_i2.p1  ORF type:complete len:211 (+),score=21.30 TRINITY_DN2778_c0_g1_i2:186-818(+)